MKINKLVILIGFTIIVFIYNMINSYALNTETIYATNNNCSLSNSGKYQSADNNGNLSNKNINTTYQGKSYYLSFSFEEPILTTKVNEIKITFMSNDLLQSVVPNYIKVRTYDTSCETDWATILSIEKNTNTGNITTITIDYIPQMNSTKADVLIGNDISIMAVTGETTYGIKSVQTGDRDSQGNEDIIINNNQNTQNIINNENQNTQNIIDNQNSIAQQQHEDQKVCENISIKNGNGYTTTSGYLNANNDVVSSDAYKYTDYITITKDETYTLTLNYNAGTPSYCLYNDSKTLISCIPYSSNRTISISNSNASFIRYSFKITDYGETTLTGKNCKNGNQALTDSVDDLNDSIKDDSVDDSSAVDFFNSFSDNTHGLSGIISAPINAINQLLNNNCSPLSATYQGKTVELACGYEFWNKISNIRTFLNVVLDGLICYRILVKLFKMMEQLKNPEDDRVEVMDL